MNIGSERQEKSIKINSPRRTHPHFCHRYREVAHVPFGFVFFHKVEDLWMIEMVNLGLSNPFIGRHCRPAPSLYSNPLSCTSCQRSDYTVLSIVVVYLIRSSPLIAIRQRQSTGPHQKPTSGAIGYLTVHTPSLSFRCAEEVFPLLGAI